MFTAAGCLFMSDMHVLAGYQPHKKTAVISGFGGKRKDGEEPLTTAWRETLEELFGWSEVPEDSLQAGMNEAPILSNESNGYVQVVYSFEALERVLKGVSKQSPLYSQLPRSVAELVFKRNQWKLTEVPVLCILPVEGQVIANHFVRDIFSVVNRNQCHDDPLFEEE